MLKKFEKAIDNAHGGVSLRSIGSADEEKDDKSSDVESETAETGIRFSKKREDYPYSMQTVIQEYMESVDEDLFNVATEHRNNKNTPFVRQKICEVDADFVSEIQAIFDMDITGFTVNINTSAFNHIEKRHGLNGEADKSMANLKDLARIGYVIENKDSVEPILKNGEQVYSKEFSKKDGEPAPLILLKKKINGTYYCAIAVTDGKYKKVWVQSAFINKRDGLTQILHDEISSLSYTSETVPASHPSTDIIPESGENVKTDERKSVQRSYNPSNEVDSEGSSLSEAQAEFFKDSKVRDENGNLLVVYHGSQAQFTEFKHKYINLHGSQEGRGFYFTDKKLMAQGYEREGGQLLKGYLNITKPLSDTEFTLTRAEIKKLLKALDPTGDDIVINYDTEGGMGYPSQAWYNRAFNDALNAIMNYCDTDSEVLAEIRNSGADEETLLNTVREVLGYDGYIVSDKYEGASVFVAFESNQFKNADNKAPTFNPDIRYSKKRSYTPGEDVNGKKITLGMSDAERTEILKNKNIKLSAETNNEKIEQAQEKHEFTEESFNLANFADKRSLVIKVGDEFGVFKNYHNEDIELSFQYSRNNAREGMDKQKKQYYDFVKMLSCFDLVIENAVGIEMHNRNSEGYKKDITLKNMYVLASAFVDGNEVVPVKLEIKEFTDKPSSLYVAIALERIDIETIKKDGVVVQEVADNSVAQQVTRPSNISIAEYFKNINPKDESFYKYIPKLFLNDGVDLSKRYSKKRSYNPAEDTDIDDNGNVWSETKDGGVKLLFSMPDFSNPTYEKKNAPGYRLSDTYDGESPEQYVIVGKHNILTEYSKLNKFIADNIAEFYHKIKHLTNYFPCSIMKVDKSTRKEGNHGKRKICALCSLHRKNCKEH